MVDLRGRGKWKVELGREMEVKIEVLLSVADSGGISKARRGWHHEQGQGLRPRGR